MVRKLKSGASSGREAKAIETPPVQQPPAASEPSDARPRDAAAISAAFKAFLDADDLPPMLEAFELVVALAGLKVAGDSDAGDFYVRCRSRLQPHLNYKQKAAFKPLDEQLNLYASTYNDCRGLTCVVVGAGPVGLRTAIGLTLLGAKVRLIEKRRGFGRCNVLHLWEWVCADLLRLGANGGEILGKSFFHIGTRQLQLLLARQALLLGVSFFTGCDAEGLLPPSPSDPNPTKLWRVECNQQKPAEAAPTARLMVPCHAFLLCSGATDSLVARLGFEHTVLGTSVALGLVAHWRKGRTQQERDLEEFSWARQYNQSLFETLAQLGADLENCVYYNSHTHYMVMTPKRQSLLDFGVLRANKPTPSELLERGNVDSDKLREYARTVAAFFKLPDTCPFAEEAGGAMLFDFSSRKACTTSSRLLHDAHTRQQAVVMVVGDALIEPFWPEGGSSTGVGGLGPTAFFHGSAAGLGINRGFHSALDAIWILQAFFPNGATDHGDDMIATREELFAILKGLSAFTKANIVQAKFRGKWARKAVRTIRPLLDPPRAVASEYGLDPATRYKVWRPTARGAIQADDPVRRSGDYTMQPYSVALAGAHTLNSSMEA